MAAAHVTGVAAMVIASGVDRAPQPDRRGAKARVTASTKQLRRHRPQPRPAATQQGAGLIDAAAARPTPDAECAVSALRWCGR